MRGARNAYFWGLSSFVLLFCLVLPAPAVPLAEPVPTADLFEMTEESLQADWQENRAVVCGVGRIVHNTGQGRLLARRAALTDARRGLLLLRRRILDDPALRERALWLAGHVPPVRVLSERIEGGLYFIEVETALSRLLGRSGESYLAGEMQRLRLR
ncbi:hypothetical protein [Fretibacterium sp. OH1220_COT-178]|uniref:hypothetical protein n=1 Tax=Fretibacterium sp. OH1220_COT-178 TaxID=2491047 RepID=UPI000F5E9AC8|nr:hypothetical protein [Fretibacterium sp. OH1220_COT-178]RRD64439.1 hypothetical protein EII26_07245 [Fretibacterium sp. OH1220_COT-178]